MIIQETISKQQAIAFQVVDDSTAHPFRNASPPASIKQRLENCRREALTSDQLALKLQKAEEKRLRLLSRQDQPSTQDRINAASIRRQAIDNPSRQLNTKALEQAEQKRLEQAQRRLDRLRLHHSRVEEVCHQQALTRKESTERLRQFCTEKQERASGKREASINQKVLKAHLSCERKLIFNDASDEQLPVVVTISSEKKV